MSNILTPLSLWKDFDTSLETFPDIIEEKEEDGIKIQYLYFYGRNTSRGRVQIFAAFASSKTAAEQKNAILLLPDSSSTVNDDLLKFFASRGYSVLMPDYRGRVSGVEHYTCYPDDVKYANYYDAGRKKDYCDADAFNTSWYEWVAVARYAYKYLSERCPLAKIGAVGIRDGGEVVWKLVSMVDAACAVTVSAVGWKAYRGYPKFGTAEPVLNEERYRFIAGIDSQAYAPFVRCPVLMLCCMNDPNFDYDRAFDTFSRINEQVVDSSVISYSVHYNGGISMGSTNDMFMFLDKHVKERKVFIPKPLEITVYADSEQNLMAKVKADSYGEVEEIGLFLSEDCLEASLREWIATRYKGKNKDGAHEFYLDIYEKTSAIFVLCYATYSNGFTVWSKISVKKIKGKFRNMCGKKRIIFSSLDKGESFSISDSSSCAVGGVFFTSKDIIPKLVEKNGLKGLYSPCGLMTLRTNSPCYAALNKNSILKLDIYCDNDAMVKFCMQDMSSGESFISKEFIAGGVWQNVLLQAKNFKNKNGMPISGFDLKIKFMINCNEPFAVNNIIWL